MSEVTSPILRAMFENGAYFTVSRLPGQDETLALADRLIREGVERIEGISARRTLDERGLTRLHEVLPAERIGALRDSVMAELRPELFRLAARIGRGFLGLADEFYVDDYTILRINFPYEVAVRSSPQAENPGIGRIDPATAALARSRRVIDPVYNPKEYHNHTPPASWAHGAHQDTWTGHSRFGVNLWWAIDEVLPENSMIFHPGTWGNRFEPDPRSLYLKEGYELPKPVKMSLRRGEMLVFNPEMLHATHVNTTDRTRLAVSTRINPAAPTFDPSCFYAKEFWHAASDLEQGVFDRVIQFRREDHLVGAPAALGAEASGGASAEAGPRCREPIPLGAPDADGWIRVFPAARLGANDRINVLLEDGREVLLLRRGGDPVAVQSRCAHLKVRLADGYVDERSIFCPAHGVEYDLSSGRSSCDLLRLAVWPVEERDGLIRLHPAPIEPDVIALGDVAADPVRDSSAGPTCGSNGHAQERAA
jgi:nitrite reductase/ring-hydroxylating ferredoxin subunit